MKKGAVLYGLNIYDLVITMIGIHVYGLIESNPIMEYFLSHAQKELFLVKVIAMGFICSYLGKREEPYVKLILDALIVLYMLFGIFNTLIVLTEAFA